MSLFPETPVFNTASMLRRDKWLIRLRWLALLGLTAGVIYFSVFQLGDSDIILKISLVAVVLLLSNSAYWAYATNRKQYSMLELVSLLNIQMVVDLILLTLLVYFTGSGESPLVFFYLFHIILASIIFPGGFSYIYSGLVMTFYSIPLLLEYFGVIGHIHFFHGDHPMEEPSVIILKWVMMMITVFGAAYLAQNVTNRHRRVYKRLKSANKKLQELNESKTTFFRFASHEMKAPIATIQSTLMVVEDVLGDKVDTQVHDMLGRAINRTAEVIEMLKDLADLTYGNFQEQQRFEALDLKLMLSELVTNNKVDAERKKQNLSLNLPRRECIYWGDMMALKKVFLNLITNAIRYTQTGGEVSVTLSHHDEYYTIDVQDNGVGIPKEEQVNIFKEFYRTPSARKQVSEGTGLGLAIVLRMIELHEGTITVTSNEGEGSRFTVTLPLEEHL